MIVVERVQALYIHAALHLWAFFEIGYKMDKKMDKIAKEKNI